MKRSYLLTTKITADVNTSLEFLHTVQDLGGSFHVRRNVWCLIMSSIKFMSYINARSLFCMQISKRDLNRCYFNFQCLNIPISKCPQFVVIF